MDGIQKMILRCNVGSSNYKIFIFSVANMLTTLLSMTFWGDYVLPGVNKITQIHSV